MHITSTSVSSMSSEDNYLTDDINVLIGTSHNDNLTGTEDGDLLVGINGHDSLFGLSGKDFMVGGKGDDLIEGGADQDVLLGGKGNDSLLGNEGDDRIIGGLGEDVAKYERSQQDFIFKGTPEEFQVVGSDGTDTLQGIESVEFENGLVATDTLNFLPAPLFDEVETVETTIPDTGDAIDIYLPEGAADKSLPVAIFLPGANVDKSNYSIFANTVASYGFAVAVPNNLRTIELPPPAPNLTGLLTELPQINEVFDYIRDPEVSPVADSVDPDKLALLGHSFGGAAGLYALQGSSNIPNSPLGEFDRPDELAGGVFFGTDLRPSLNTDENAEPIPIPPLDNADIPAALILGTNDGISFPAETEETYQQIQDPPKALIEVEGANHFGIANENDPLNPSTTPEEVPPITPEPNAQTISQAVSIDTIATWSSLFLRSTVLGDEAATDFVFGGTGDELDSNVDVTSEASIF